MSDRRQDIRRHDPDDWRIERDLRLAALSDAPRAFGASLEDALRYDEHAWRERLAGQVRLAAFAGDHPVGMAGWAWARRPYPEGESLLLGMWVAPSARGSGVGDALVQAILEDARRAGSRRVRLSVTPGNDAAQRLYARNGFVVLPSEARVEQNMTEMIRPLTPGPGDGAVRSAAV